MCIFIIHVGQRSWTLFRYFFKSGMEIPTPYVGKPVRPADAVLTEVLNSISPGFDLSENLMEQGLTSFNAMQIVTRCAEQGYRVQLNDVIINPTFEGIVSRMTPGEGTE